MVGRPGSPPWQMQGEGVEMASSQRFPRESEEYRRARNSLLRAEVRLRRQIEAVAEQRRSLPLGGQVLTDYVFEAAKPADGELTTIRLSELFAPGKRTLFLYNFMFPESVDSDAPCPSCTSIIDAIDGSARPLSQRINFAAIAKAPIAKSRQGAGNRGRQPAPLPSSARNNFNRDYRV